MLVGWPNYENEWCVRDDSPTLPSSFYIEASTKNVRRNPTLAFIPIHRSSESMWNKFVVSAPQGFSSVTQDTWFTVLILATNKQLTFELNGLNTNLLSSRLIFSFLFLFEARRIVFVRKNPSNWNGSYNLREHPQTPPFQHCQGKHRLTRTTPSG